MRNVFTILPVLADAASYPESTWASQRTKYWNYWYHFDGDFLDESVGGTLRYPLKMNIYNMACMLHAGFLFGEVPDGGDPLVITEVESWGQNSTDAEKDLSKKMRDIVYRVWYENDGRALQQEGGIVAQVAGGVPYGVAYDPSLKDQGKLPIRIDLVQPEFFYPLWAHNRYWTLQEAIVCFLTSGKLGGSYYGVSNLDSVTEYRYQENWAPGKFHITVDEKTVTWGGVKQEGVPVGGIVPYTYIPHVRVGDFYGISLLVNKDELAKEVNARFADLGDIVEENALQIPAVWNTRQPTIRRIGRSNPVMDLGTTMPGMGEPGVRYPTSTQANVATVKYANDLLNLARTEAYTPPIVYGLDEGSQRSALTLMTRMIPLLVHIRHERNMWTPGLNQIARHILTIAAEKGIEGLKPGDVKLMRIWQDWAPVLPRGRNELINEIILRMNAGLIDPELALDKLGDIRDIKTATNLIKEWLEFKASLGAQGSNPFGGAGSQGEQAGLERPQEPRPTMNQEDS